MFFEVVVIMTFILQVRKLMLIVAVSGLRS